MVLRDSYISGLLRSVSFTLVLLTFACQHSESPAANKADAGTISTNNPISNQIQSMRLETQQTLTELNRQFQQAQALKLGSPEEKVLTSKENIDAVFEKAATSMGAAFVLQGSLDAVEKRFLANELSQEQAQEMIDKFKIDLKSYQTDRDDYHKMLNGNAETEKK